MKFLFFLLFFHCCLDSFAGVKFDASHFPDLQMRAFSDEEFFKVTYSNWMRNAFTKSFGVGKRVSPALYEQRSNQSLSRLYHLRASGDLPPRKMAIQIPIGMGLPVWQSLISVGYTSREPSFHKWLGYWQEKLGIRNVDIYRPAGLDGGYYSELKAGQAVRRGTGKLVPTFPSRIVALVIVSRFPIPPEEQAVGYASAGFLSVNEGRVTPEPVWSNYPYLALDCSYLFARPPGLKEIDGF